MFRQTLIDFPSRKPRSTRNTSKVLVQERNENKEVKVSNPVVTSKRHAAKRKLDLDINNGVDIQNAGTSKRNVISSYKHRLFDENEPLSVNIAPVVTLSSYQKTKQALHSSLPDRLLGRDEEKLKITNFLLSHLQNKQAGSLYISGPPGTGKTALLVSLLSEMASHKFKHVYINCMSLKQSISVFQRIAKELNVKNTDTSRRTIDEVGKLIVSTQNMIVVVLDEIDQLDSKNQEVLYTLFEWPHLPNSKIILIGIANALDLTDRVLPRLHAYGCKPELLNFQPYTYQQILNILEDRMKAAEVDDIKIIQTSALALCARKIAATSGDVRKALDVCRRALEMAESQSKQQSVLKVSFDDGFNPGSPKKRLALAIPLQVNISHINSILHEVYGSRVVPCKSSENDERSIPLQQKVILCTVLLIVKTIKSKEVNVGNLHSTYSEVCKRRKISSLNQTEFFSACFLLEAQGLININKKKDTRSSRISLKVDERELETVLQDRVLMASILGECNIVKKFR